MAALKGLLSSPDATTSRFSEAALNNLSMAPATAADPDLAAAFSAGLPPADLPVGRAGSEAPGAAAGPALLGFSLPFFDGDGLGIPKFVSAK